LEFYLGEGIREGGLGENTLVKIKRTPPSLLVGGLEKGKRKNTRRRRHG
jgi:hypothetical protein